MRRLSGSSWLVGVLGCILALGGCSSDPESTMVGGTGADPGATSGGTNNGSTTTTGGGNGSTSSGQPGPSEPEPDAGEPRDPNGDDDKDGIPNGKDVCPDIADPDQPDGDKDEVGDLCDNCVRVANDEQKDSDKDGIGDECDPDSTDNPGVIDSDGDGIVDLDDKCPAVKDANNNADADADGRGDVCDNCPLVANSTQEDADGDKLGNACDDSTVIDDTNSCGESSTKANQLAANLYFVIDESGSMTSSACATCGSRVQEWEMALPTLATSLTDGRFNIGVSQFAAGTSDATAPACTSLPVQTMAMQAMPTAATVQAAGDITPAGGTPTAAALLGTRDPNRDGNTADARWHLPNDPLDTQRSKSVILVTDGAPTTCPGSGSGEPNPGLPGDTIFAAARETITQARAIAAEKVSVNLIGFAGVNVDLMQLLANAGDPVHPGPYQVCNSNAAIALPCICANSYTGGSTDVAFNPTGCTPVAMVQKSVWYSASDTMSIITAVNTIVGRSASCNLQIQDTGLGTVDPKVTQVVLVKTGAAPTPIPPTDWTLAGNTIAIAEAYCKQLIDLLATDPDARIEVLQGCACKPETEKCDNLTDDDCDGLINEGCPGVPPEVCDGADNDGDGTVDEGCPIGAE